MDHGGVKARKKYVFDKNGGRIPLENCGYRTKKISTIDWKDQTKAEEWRRAWAELCNIFLEQNHIGEYIDHRSYERQGVDLIPTVYLGSAAVQMKRRRLVTSRGEHNRKAIVSNNMLRQLHARISKLQKQLGALVEKHDTQEIPSPSINLVETLLVILQNPQEKGRYRKVADLKNIAKAISFLQENRIADARGLQEKVTEIRQRFDIVSDTLKKTERRLKTLDEHLRNAETYFQYWPIYRDYVRQRTGKREIFYQKHHTMLALYESVRKVFTRRTEWTQNHSVENMEGRSRLLGCKKAMMYQEYHLLKDEAREVDLIQRSVAQSVWNETKKEQKKMHER